jgi:YVTN family beta-propeller protein
MIWKYKYILIFLMLLIFFCWNELQYCIYAESLHNQILDFMEDSITQKNKNTQINTGDTPVVVVGNIDDNGKMNTVYVVNSKSNTVSVISGDNNTKLVDIPVGDNPSDIAVNTFTNTVYVSNRNSGGLSVIDSYSDMVVAGIKFQITPILSGYIKM